MSGSVTPGGQSGMQMSAAYSPETSMTKSRKAKRRNKHKHRVKVHRLDISDGEINEIIKHLSLGNTDRVTFEQFVASMGNSHLNRNVAEASLQKVQTLFLVLTEEWRKFEAKQAAMEVIGGPTLKDDDIDRVIDFLDPNGDGIDCSELEEAFRLIKRSAAAEEMEKGAIKCMKTLMRRMKRKNQKLDDLFKELDKSGDGIVSHAEIADWLSNCGVQIDDINATLRYLDPDNDGDMETDELASAMRRAEVTVGRLEVSDEQILKRNKTYPLSFHSAQIEEKEQNIIMEKVSSADKAYKAALAMQPDSFTTAEISKVSVLNGRRENIIREPRA